MVESVGKLTGKLEVLALVFSDRDRDGTTEIMMSQTTTFVLQRKTRH